VTVENGACSFTLTSSPSISTRSSPHIIYRDDSIQQHSAHHRHLTWPSLSARRSLLLSTLLQPFAILLGIWYIVHLPVRFGRVSLRPDAVNEAHFRLVSVNSRTWVPCNLLKPMHRFVLSFLGACLRTSGWTIIRFPTRLGKVLLFFRRLAP
jgi:hypothetical protein